MPTPACCPCGSLVGCVCDGIVCATACRKKTGTATLCGYPEFSSPSTPPKAYKRRVTGGTMTIAKFVESSCGGPSSLSATCECQSKTTTASLCGYAEYVSPSTPPRAYRRQTISGNVRDCYFGSDATCVTPVGPPLGSQLTVFSGAYQYNANSCAETNTQHRDNYSDMSACAVSTFVNTQGLARDISAGVFQSLAGFAHAFDVITQISKTTVLGGNCFDFFGRRTSTSTGRLDLADEDTTADAVARANAGIGWSASGACSLHTSYRGQSSSSFAISYRSAQTRAIVTGTTVGMRLHIQFQIYRRVRGSGSAYSAYTTIDIFPTASGTGYTSAWQDLPQDDTYEYLMNGCTAQGNIEEDVVDTWDVVDDFGPGLPAACSVATTDHSTRVDDGVPVLWPWALFNPPTAYATFATAFSSATSRITTGNNICQSFEAGYAKFIGTVNEDLSSEDTDDDAYARAVAVATFGDCLLGCLMGCSAFRSQRTTGFSFGFSTVQTRVGWTATIGVTYKVTIRFARRILGSSGPYLFFSLIELTILADAVDELTDWQDVPNEEAGWDTVAANCSVEIVP